jgi:hypothetical protein
VTAIRVALAALMIAGIVGLMVSLAVLVRQ